MKFLKKNWPTVLAQLFLVILIISLFGCTPNNGSAVGSTAGAAPGTPPTGVVTPAQFIINTVWYFLMGFFIYWYLVIRPDLQNSQSRKKFVEELKKNDEAVTSGGIYGRVFAVKPDSITLEIAPNVRIRVHPDNIVPPSSLRKTPAAADVPEISEAKK